MLPQRLAILNRLGLVPTWAWDARNGVLPSGATFTRASAGWSFNNAGVLVQASSNVARFDYDPVSKAPFGFLAEPQSTNLLANSQTINGNFTITNATVTDNAAVAPDGTTTLASIVEDASAASTHFFSKSVAFTSGSSYTISCFAKAGARNWVALVLPGAAFTTALLAYFDLSSGTIGNLSAGLSATIRSVGGGLYRISATAIATATASGSVNYRLASANGTSSYDGNGVGSALFWGMQVESGVGLTSYIPTSGSTATRSQDSLTLPLASMPGWNGSAGGVLVATYRQYGAVSTGVPLTLDDTSSNNRVLLLANSSGAQRGSTSSGGVVQINIISGTTPAPFVRSKMAFGWSPARGFLAADGSVIGGASGSFALPVGLSRALFGFQSSANVLNGSLESVAYYAGAKSDSFVQGASR